MRHSLVPLKNVLPIPYNHALKPTLLNLLFLPNAKHRAYLCSVAVYAAQSYPMKHLAFFLLFFSSVAFAQVTNTAVMDTSDFRFQGKLTVEGYIDAYYAYDFNQPADGNRPYAVSMHRHNEMTINLAFIDLKYSSSRLRARLVPGFGTYMNANYAAEPGTLKNLVEASAGIRVFNHKNIWLDVGVFGSPYTNESALSKDHLAYTRSFAPEFVPYYLSGIKLSMPLMAKLNATVYLLNGWQQIADINSGKAVGTQLEYRPSDYLLLNWNTFVGRERSAIDTHMGARYFTDVFLIYSKNKWSWTACAYIGQQEQANGTATWWTTNAIARYALTKKLSATLRGEYFEDLKSVQVISLSPVGFNSSSSSLGLNYKAAENMLLRVEGRAFMSNNNVYQRNNRFTNNSTLLTANLTMWF